MERDYGRRSGRSIRQQAVLQSLMALPCLVHVVVSHEESLNTVHVGRVAAKVVFELCRQGHVRLIITDYVYSNFANTNSELLAMVMDCTDNCLHGELGTQAIGHRPTALKVKTPKCLDFNFSSNMFFQSIRSTFESNGK